ncbi:MAG: aspartate carbamoyltransferase regulatory subunit [Candidatus Diapherotrites archaeon]|nr:aspartate carbamoyltransferase regulatory subunit [Candidatus Diapherotrites archaeon]
MSEQKSLGQEKKIFVKPIVEGTAIDHLDPGTSVHILKFLSISNFQVTAAMNVDSRKMGKKDLIFIAGKKLSESEIHKIALLGRGATVNLIHGSKIIKKEKIDIPLRAEGIIKCINPQCITNFEGIPTKFSIQKKPLSAVCFYCETKMSEKEIINAIQ